jgi:hypothetical protein
VIYPNSIVNPITESESQQQISLNFGFFPNTLLSEQYNRQFAMSSRNSTKTSNTKPSATKTSNTKPSATKAKTPRNTTSPGPAKANTPTNTTSPGPSTANTPTKGRSPVCPHKVKHGREALLEFVKGMDMTGKQVIDGIPVDEIVDLHLSGMITEGDTPLLSTYKQHDLLNEQKDHLLSFFTVIEKTTNPPQLHNQMRLYHVLQQMALGCLVSHTLLSMICLKVLSKPTRTTGQDSPSTCWATRQTLAMLS